MMFTTYRPRGANFTPAALIYEWAKATGAENWQTLDGIRVRAGGGVWRYQHYEIDDDGDRDRITVYLEPAR